MRKCDIIINQNKKKFIHQAYLKNDFANVLLLDQKGSVDLGFRLCFKRMEVVGTWSKETKRWKEISKTIDVKNLMQKLDEIHNKESTNVNNQLKLQLSAHE